MTSEEPACADERTLNVKTLKMIGFKVLLSWHYLVLFSPLFIGAIEQPSFSLFFQRQLTLYLTLAVSFGILVGIGRRLLRKNGTTPSPSLLVFAGVLAALATLLSALVLDAPDPLKLTAVVLLGFSEALLMFLWLHYYTVAAAGHLVRSFAVDMMFGGIIGFLTCSLHHPIGLAVAVCLPLVATASLILNWKTVEPTAEVEHPAVGHPSRKSIMRHSLKTLLPTMVYAFVFGLIQGGFLVSDVALLMAGNPVILVGIVVAGAIIFFIREQPDANADIDVMHRCSLLFFVLGVVGLSFIGHGDVILLASETAILAGFNLFDFGGLILGVGLARSLKPGSLMLVDGGRVLTYASLALGLAMGDRFMVMLDGEQNEFVLLALCGIAIALLTATVLTPFRDQESFEIRMAREAAANRPGIAAHSRKSRARADSGEVSAALLAEGTGWAGGDGPCRRPAREGDHAGPSSCAHGVAMDRFAQTKGPSPHHFEEPKRIDTPWRRTCQDIAGLYKLSPRETEIFFLIAKGRNADFVQQKLVISTHTAKTHIANIYHKLGVHSSQEMLSLIETFREEERRDREQKEG